MTRRVNYADDYVQVKIQSATPMGLIYMLYEHTLVTLEESKTALSSRDRDLFCKKNLHAQDCIRELRGSLNLNVGEIAHSLFKLYDFMINQLIEANLTKENPLPFVNRVEKMLKELLDTWKIAEKSLQKQKVAEQARVPQEISIMG